MRPLVPDATLIHARDVLDKALSQVDEVDWMVATYRHCGFSVNPMREWHFSLDVTVSRIANKDESSIVYNSTAVADNERNGARRRVIHAWAARLVQQMGE